MSNSLFDKSIRKAVEIQSVLNELKSEGKELRTKVNASSLTQYVHLIHANAVATKPVKTRSKQSKEIRDMLVVAGTTERDALTKVSTCFSAKILKLFKDFDKKSDAQGVMDILEEHDLTTVNKLKRFVAGPVDKVQQLIEAIEKLENEDRHSLFAGCDGMGWLEQYK
jgi:hypothetical protein